jgi:hypothetical protein
MTPEFSPLHSQNSDIGSYFDLSLLQDKCEFIYMLKKSRGVEVYTHAVAFLLSVYESLASHSGSLVPMLI